MAPDPPSPLDERDAPPPSRLLALAALVGGLAMVAAIAVVWGALTIAYGAEPFPWIAVVIVTVIPALLLAIGIDMVLRAFRGSSPGYWPIAAVVYVLVVIAMVTLLKAAHREYVEETARMQAACGQTEIVVLVNLPPLGVATPTVPTGDRTGACTSTFYVPAGSSGALSVVSAAMAAAGWTVSTPTDATFTATKGGVTVTGRLGATDDKGQTAVEVSVPGPGAAPAPA
jgi:hypothetical protein